MKKLFVALLTLIALNWYLLSSAHADTNVEEQINIVLPLEPDLISKFAYKFPNLPYPELERLKVVDGAALLKDDCDVIYMLISLSEQMNPAFISLKNNSSLIHRLEICASNRFFEKNMISREDSSNTFKLEEYRKKYMAEARKVIDSIKSVKRFHTQTSVYLHHYNQTIPGFTLKVQFDGLETIRKSPERKMIDAFGTDPLQQLDFSPLYFSREGEVIIKPEKRDDAIKIENIISKYDEYFHADVFFNPVKLDGKLEEIDQISQKKLDNVYLQVRVSAVIFYPNDTSIEAYERKLNSVLFTTTSP